MACFGIILKRVKEFGDYGEHHFGLWINYPYLCRQNPLTCTSTSFQMAKIVFFLVFHRLIL